MSLAALRSTAPVLRTTLVAALLTGCASSGAGTPPDDAPAPRSLPADAPAPPEPDRITFQEGWSQESATDDSMTARIRESARQLGPQGSPRVAFADLRFPAGAAERRALGGHGVLRLTAVTRDPGELPPARVFARGESGETELPLIRGRRSRVPDSEEEIGSRIGRERVDAIYLLPLHVTARPGALVVDFARSRSGFVLAELPLVPADTPWASQPPSGPPDADALEAMIARDLPGFAAPPSRGLRDPEGSRTSPRR